MIPEPGALEVLADRAAFLVVVHVDDGPRQLEVFVRFGTPPAAELAEGRARVGGRKSGGNSGSRSAGPPSR